MKSWKRFSTQLFTAVPGSESWITRSLNLSKDEVEEKAGLDHAMYLEFLELSMRTGFTFTKKKEKMRKKGRQNDFEKLTQG